MKKMNLFGLDRNSHNIVLGKEPFKVVIDLENGLYVFDNGSAMGKTFLYNILSKLALSEVESEVKILAYTYDDFTKNVKFDAAGKNLVMVDRYDLYANSDMNSKLVDAGKQAIVLVDLKNANYFQCRQTYIDFDKCGVHVYI